VASTADVLGQIERAFADPPRPADNQLLHPAGFRHYLPAYMSFALRHRDSGAAVVGSTVYALTPSHGDLREFSLSKFALFDDAQRSAALAFLEAMASHEDVDEALEYWRSEVRGPRRRP